MYRFYQFQNNILFGARFIIALVWIFAFINWMISLATSSPVKDIDSFGWACLVGISLFLSMVADMQSKSVQKKMEVWK